MNDSLIDIRMLHLLYEHKILMEMRVKYLLEYNYISEKYINLSEFEDIKDKFLQLRNVAIRYMINKKDELLYDIANRLHVLILSDKELLKKLLHELKKYEYTYNNRKNKL
jgi:hypothetical protein